MNNSEDYIKALEKKLKQLEVVCRSQEIKLGLYNSVLRYSSKYSFFNRIVQQLNFKIPKAKDLSSIEKELIQMEADGLLDLDPNA